VVRFTFRPLYDRRSPLYSLGRKLDRSKNRPGYFSEEEPMILPEYESPLVYLGVKTLLRSFGSTTTLTQGIGSRITQNRVFCVWYLNVLKEEWDSSGGTVVFVQMNILAIRSYLCHYLQNYNSTISKPNIRKVASLTRAVRLTVTWWKLNQHQPKLHSFFDLGTRWRWVVSFMPRPLYPQGKSPCYPLDRSIILFWLHLKGPRCVE
jgi:hypothetical protein